MENFNVQPQATFDQEKLSKAAFLMRAIAHPLRIQIINYIIDKEKVNVYHIYTDLQIEQSITSQHLRILRESELVKTQRKGKFIFYSINQSLLDRINRVILRSFRR